jgi:hypothetical protein
MENFKILPSSEIKDRSGGLSRARTDGAGILSGCVYCSNHSKMPLESQHKVQNSLETWNVLCKYLRSVTKNQQVVAGTDRSLARLTSNFYSALLNF